ncbi:MAG: DUF2142 domain-containing protein [Clostridia bacterium]|nr:DUF2142 domain-containing protein [Clostridia bacterium]
MSKTKKILFAIISLVLIFSFLSLFNYSAKGKLEPLKQWNASEISDNGSLTGYTTYEKDGETVYKSLVTGAYIKLSFDEQKFNTVVINLNNEIGEKAVAMLFYDAESETFLGSEDYLSSHIVAEGQTIMFRSSEPLKSDCIALNIDGEFSVKDVTMYMVNGSSASLQLSYIALAVLLLTIALVAIFERKLGYFGFFADKIRNEAALLRELREGKKLAYILHIAAVVSSLLLALSIAVLISISHYSIAAIFVIFFLAVIAVALQLADRISSGRGAGAAKLFLVVSLLVGIMMSYTSPASTHTSWDDEIHLRHAYEASNIFESETTIAKYKMFSHNYRVSEYLSNPTTFAKTIAEENEISAVYDFESVNSYTLISYAPMIAVNLLASAFSVDLAKIIVLCRLANLFAYAFICYIGIKKLRGGAFIFSAVCLLPSVLYLSCSIGYDFWLTAWLVYGFAYIISELQQPDKKIQTKDVIKILLAFFIGCSAKAIYCLMMLPLMFLGKDKFPTPKHAKRFRLFVVLTIVLIAAILIVPGLLFFDLYSDSRGGSDVSSYGQISYILSNPLEYASTLLRHLGNYCSIARFNEYNSTYGFIDGYEGSGSMFFGTIATAIIMLCIFTDRKKDELYESRRMQIMRWVVLMTCFIQVVFIVTSMYIGFTAVGWRQIVGTQFRYLFPLMCPLFFFMRPKRSLNYFGTKSYEAWVFGGLAFNLFIGYLLTYLIYI